jgi:PBP1b-binding outer membrane lipoprotein LpoB
MNRNEKMRNIVLFLLMVVLFSGCFRDSKPRNTLKHEKFVEVLTDIHIAEAMYLDRKRIELDSLQSKPAYLSVLKKHNVSEEKMLNTTLYFSRHPREYDKIYTEVVSRMGIMIEELKGVKQTPEKNETP